MNVRAEHRLSAALPGHAARRDPRSGSRRPRGSCASTICWTRRSADSSGGDRQRVALGRAIVRRPKAFLMDEPLGALDAEFRELMCGELRALHDRIGATTVYVTHDQLEAMSMADRIAVMNHGVIEQIGTPQEIYDRPATHVRRRLHRLAADELPATSRPHCGEAHRRIQIDGAIGRMPRAVRGSRRGQARAWRAARARVVRRCRAAARPRDSAPSISARRRSSPSTTGQRARQGASALQRRRFRSARRSGSRSRPDRLSLFDAASGQALHPSLHEGGQPWLRSRCADVSKRFGAVEAVRDLSLAIADGEFVVLLGPTGAGKTTTLRLIAGLERPDRGRCGDPADAMVTDDAPADARRRLRLPAIFALSASDRLRQSGLSAALAGAPHARGRWFAAGSHQVAELLHIEQQARQPGDALCPAARCSASRSAGRWCASRRSI